MEISSLTKRKLQAEVLHVLPEKIAVEVAMHVADAYAKGYKDGQLTNIAGVTSRVMCDPIQVDLYTPTTECLTKIIEIIANK